MKPGLFEDRRVHDRWSFRPSAVGSAAVNTRRFSRALMATLFALLFGHPPVVAQETVPPSLSLEEALRIAHRNSPLLQADLNNTEAAEWNIKAAYGALVPTASASSGLSWQGSGEQQVGSVTLTDLGFGDQPSY